MKATRSERKPPGATRRLVVYIGHRRHRLTFRKSVQQWVASDLMKLIRRMAALSGPLGGFASCSFRSHYEGTDIQVERAVVENVPIAPIVVIGLLTLPPVRDFSTVATRVWFHKEANARPPANCPSPATWLRLALGSKKGGAR